MFEFGEPWWELVVRSLAIYVAMLVGFRLMGKREIGQFTLFDLVLVLLVANAVQPAITGADLSLGGGFVIIVTLLVANRGVALLTLHVPSARELLEGSPRVLAVDGKWLTGAIEKEGLTLGECEQALREHGVADVSEVRVAMLEVDGTISVVPIDQPELRRGRRTVRRRRFLRH